MRLAAPAVMVRRGCVCISNWVGGPQQPSYIMCSCAAQQRLCGVQGRACLQESLLQRCTQLCCVVLQDLNNEPHGRATWGEQCSILLLRALPLF